MWKPKVAVNSKRRQDDDFVGELEPLIQIAALFRGKPVFLFERREPLNLTANRRNAGNCVVVGDGDDIQPARARGRQPLQVGDAGLFVVV